MKRALDVLAYGTVALTVRRLVRRQLTFETEVAAAFRAAIRDLECWQKHTVKDIERAFRNDYRRG